MQFLSVLSSWKSVALVGSALGLLALAACDKHEELPDFKGAIQTNNLPWWQVAQGWDYETQMGFWYQPQGARLIPYDWFLNLEQEGSTELFRTHDNIERLKYIPAPAMARFNPDGLPIGFVKSAMPDENGTHWMGFTCAACHTAQLNLNGALTVVDGGPGLGDYATFNAELVDALIASDAFGAILNRVTAEDIAVPENRMEANAPVSYPFLWGTPQSSVVQWNGSAPNNKAGAGPLFRNVGEVVGVNGVVHVKPKQNLDFLESGDKIDNFVEKAAFFGYESSANLPNIGQIEDWLQKLRSPKWPENLLPKIDVEKAREGEALYAQKCAGCHHVVKRDQEAAAYDPVMIPIDKLGADPRMAANFLFDKNPNTGEPWKSGKLEGSRMFLVAGERYGETLPSRGAALVTVVAGVALGHPLRALEADIKSYYTKHDAMDVNLMSYKARPLTGIWATAPYMHNGSVPNAYEMLLPEEERTKEFYVGSRRYDPVRVGYDHLDTEGAFKFDTSLEGNRNTGHNYGKGLTDKQRWEIIEYLKTL